MAVPDFVKNFTFYSKHKTFFILYYGFPDSSRRILDFLDFFVNVL